VGLSEDWPDPFHPILIRPGPARAAGTSASSWPYFLDSSGSKVRGIAFAKYQEHEPQEPRSRCPENDPGPVDDVLPFGAGNPLARDVDGRRCRVRLRSIARVRRHRVPCRLLCGPERLGAHPDDQPAGRNPRGRSDGRRHRGSPVLCDDHGATRIPATARWPSTTGSQERASRPVTPGRSAPRREARAASRPSRG